MANRFACRLRHTLLAATAATTVTVIESVNMRMRHLCVNAPTQAQEKSRPAARDLGRFFPSPIKLPELLQPATCGCGSPLGVRRPYHALVYDGLDPSAVVSFSASSASPGGSGAKPKAKEKRGERENLLNVLHFSESVLPLLFDTSLYFLKFNPPQLYAPNVILENHLRTPVKTTRGLLKLTFYQHLFRMNYMYRYMLRKLIILNTWLDEEEATVNIHFRVLCCRRANLMGTAPKDVDAAVKSQLADNAEWHDYILTLHVTSHDRVWKVIITQKASDRPPKVHRPLRNLLGRLRRRLLPQPGIPVPV